MKMKEKTVTEYYINRAKENSNLHLISFKDKKEFVSSNSYKYDLYFQFEENKIVIFPRGLGLGYGFNICNDKVSWSEFEQHYVLIPDDVIEYINNYVETNSKNNLLEIVNKENEKENENDIRGVDTKRAG